MNSTTFNFQIAELRSLVVKQKSWNKKSIEIVTPAGVVTATAQLTINTIGQHFATIRYQLTGERITAAALSKLL